MDERLAVFNRQIEHARLAIDTRRSLMRLMEQEGESTEDAHKPLTQLQHSLDEMLRFRAEALRELEQSGG
ncbi:MAG: hypothetical protein ABI457_12870 [Hyphomicrobium sp.]